MKHLVAGLVLMMLATPAFSEDVQLVQSGGVYMVPVRINDAVTIPFVLDSGSSDVVIPADVFSVLQRSGTISQGDFNGVGQYTIADGSTVSSDRYALHKVTVGDHVLLDVIASVSPAKSAPLLGQTFLQRLPAWKLDNSRHLLVLNTDNLSAAELSRRGNKAYAARNYTEAMRWLRMAADQGDVVAMFNVAKLYEKGQGVEQSDTSAARWYLQAAEQGDAESMNSIGIKYGSGLGVAKNCALAKQWLDKAAAAGSWTAPINLRYWNCQ